MWTKRKEEFITEVMSLSRAGQGRLPLGGLESQEGSGFGRGLE